jgi:choline dehydrogenase-like flavoprotein
MIIDGRKFAENESFESDVCIIGAGAAGITIARSLAATQLRVCLVESGGFEFDSQTQALYEGESVGQAFAPLDATRLRFFGGSTNHWGGFCRPHEEEVFARRDHVAESGWPFGLSVLQPFYDEAQKICELGDVAYASGRWSADETKLPPLADRRLGFGVFQASPPTRFGERYRKDVAVAENVTAFLNSNVVDFEIAPSSPRVERLRIATLTARKFWIKPKLTILAAGGIENPRLLLNARSTIANGIGNENDLVGRYFMDHPLVWKSSKVLFTEGKPFLSSFVLQQLDGMRVHGFFYPTPETQARERMPTFGIILDPGSIADVSDGAASLRTIVRDVRRGEIPDRLGHHVVRALGDLDGIVAGAWRRTFGSEEALYTTRYWSECPPDRASRVSLSHKVDPLGLRRVRLEWRLPSDFERNFRRAHELLAETLGASGVGRLRLDPAQTGAQLLATVENSHHHMGTTRMHENPRQGVVDADCRVHGIRNLYIAGSSVFPTYGHANPTLTIVALALRLAEHVKSVLA